MKTQLSKPARGYARYSDECKEQALELWRASGRSAAKVAAELGHPCSAALSLGSPGTGSCNFTAWAKAPPWSGRIGGGEPALARRERQTPGAARSLKKITGHPLRSAAQRYARIQQMSGQYKVAWLCEALLVSRSGYYHWVERRRQPSLRQLENTALRERIRAEFARSRQTYGSPRLAHALGCPGRRNRIARLMRAERLFARQRSKYRVRTTDSRHGGPIAPNRLTNLKIHQPDQVWVLGWAMHQSLDTRLVSAALRMALLQRRPRASLIVHSDRGMQFASAAYRQLLAQHGLVASMSRKGNCYDNAFIEAFWSSLKYETVYHQRFATFTQARSAIFHYIETFYNRTRLHSSLAYRSPIAFESQLNQKTNNP